MQLSDFNYHLPEALIARYPRERRRDSRLLVLNGSDGTIQHQQFTNVIDLLQPNDLLIFNNTKVIPARLYGNKITGGKVEILLERMIDDHHFLALIGASKKTKPNSKINITEDVSLTVIEKRDEFYLLACEHPVLSILNAHGNIPLPPYLNREAEDSDRERYQTIYAEKPGAVAAPTAGLHFDEQLLQQVVAKGVVTGMVTLHVGAGTFQPVRVNMIAQHKMHKEYFEVSASLCEKIQTTKNNGGRIIAVGTTTVRSLETIARQGKITPFTGETDIFIYPGFEFKIVDAMITNFHLPESTLLMLVCAFAGFEPVMQAYQQAVEKKYRFFSYGDAMFVTR